MKITVSGRLTKTRNMVLGVASTYAEILNLDNSKYELTIHTVTGLQATRNIRGGAGITSEYNLGMVLDNRLNMEIMFQTLAHEMIHVKQYALGQLRSYYRADDDHGFVWLGKEYSSEDYNNYNSPWELEAFGRERLLSNQVIQLFI